MAVEPFGGRYDITGRLTSAGPVVVYAADDRWLRRGVALAVHDADHAVRADHPSIDDPRAAATVSEVGSGAEASSGPEAPGGSGFESLGRAFLRVAHPNIADVYDAGRHDGAVFVAFERPAGDLATELAAGPWDDGRLARLAAELTAAVDALHRAGACLDLLHPGCVGLAADGRVQLVPWPLTPPPPGWGGERAWLAPERIDGGAPSAQADLWSVGAVVLSAMIGAGPGRLDDDGVAEMSQRIMRGLDPVLVGATARSLSRDLSVRYASATDMAAALDGSGGGAGSADVSGSHLPPVAPPRIRTRPLGIPAPARGRWGWRASAALVAGMCLPFLILQLESAPPSVAGCGRTAPHGPGCADAPSARPVEPSPRGFSVVAASPLVTTRGSTAAAAPAGQPASVGPARAAGPAVVAPPVAQNAQAPPPEQASGQQRGPAAVSPPGEAHRLAHYNRAPRREGHLGRGR